MTTSTSTENNSTENNSTTHDQDGAQPPQQVYETGQVVHVDPATLLLQRNIRTGKTDPDLVKSIKDVGVLQPITAVLTETGDLLVRMGERRTLAAIEAGRPTVPVYVEGTDTIQDAAEVERIIRQRDENTHRTALTTAEDLGVVMQLAAFGLSANQISKRARIKRGDVDTALTVAASDLAKAATMRHEDLTLDQAAVVAEFEDDTETVTALIAATKTGQFDHVAQRARNARDRAQVKREAVEAIEAAGVRVIEQPGSPGSADNSPAQRLSYLTDDKSQMLDAANHAECPGHVAWLTQVWGWVDTEGNPIVDDEDDQDEDSTEDGDEEGAAVDPYADAVQKMLWTPTYACDSPAEHGHHARFTETSSAGGAGKPEVSEAEREKARQERRTVIENNKAWDAAETVRRAWLPNLAARKTPPKGSGAFLATALTRDAHVLNESGGDKFAAEWLAVKASPYGRSDYSKVIDKASEARAIVLALVQVLAAYEARTSRADWRNTNGDSPAGRYLRFLASVGYTLSEVEQIATGTTKTT